VPLQTPYGHTIQYFWGFWWVALSREASLKGKAQDSWPPGTNLFISAAFDNANSIYVLTKTSYLHEVNCTEPSPSASVPCTIQGLLIGCSNLRNDWLSRCWNSSIFHLYLETLESEPSMQSKFSIWKCRVGLPFAPSPIRLLWWWVQWDRKCES
jgi:hypothetical protein